MNLRDYLKESFLKVNPVRPIFNIPEKFPKKNPNRKEKSNEKKRSVHVKPHN